MKATDLLDMIRRCAADAQRREPGEIDARAQAFIAMLSGCLDRYDAVAADMVISLLKQPIKDAPK